MIIIDLGNIGSKEQVERIEKAVNGETYFDFKVEYGIVQHNYPTTVTTDVDERSDKSEERIAELKKEAKEMLMFILACAV